MKADGHEDGDEELSDVIMETPVVAEVMGGDVPPPPPPPRRASHISAVNSSSFSSSSQSSSLLASPPHLSVAAAAAASSGTRKRRRQRRGRPDNEEENDRRHAYQVVACGTFLDAACFPQLDPEKVRAGGQPMLWGTAAAASFVAASDG